MEGVGATPPSPVVPVAVPTSPAAIAPSTAMNQSTETSPADEECRNDNFSQTQVPEAQFDLSLPLPPHVVQSDHPVPALDHELCLADPHRSSGKGDTRVDAGVLPPEEEVVDAHSVVPTNDPVSLKPGQKIMMKLGENGDEGNGWKELDLVSRYRKGKDAKVKD